MFGLLLSVSLFISNPADNGVRNIRVEFTEWPRVVRGIAAEDFVHETHRVDLGESFTFYAGGSFIGLDRGDIGEFDVRIGCENGPIFYERSLHKETAAPYDAEDWKYTAWPRCRVLLIDFIARVTGPNDILRPGQEWNARPHFGVRLWTWPDGAAVKPSDPVDPSNPNPDPIKKETDYIPLKDRAEWSEKVDNAYSEWRGDRDLAFLAIHSEMVAAFEFDADKLAADVAALYAIHEERNTLTHRIATADEHPEFPGRLTIRKKVVNEFVIRAAEVSKASYAPYVDEASAKGVRWGAGFDSWQGFISGNHFAEWQASR
jgi:hypothetical protein